jgi:Sulfotransferase domain
VWTRDGDPEQHLAELTALATRHFLATWVSEEGARIVGDKTPLTAPDVIEEVARMVPEAKVIHIIRDGRDVAVSSIHHIWNHAADEGGIHTLSAEERALRDQYRKDPEGFRREGRSIFIGNRLRSTAKNWATMTARARADGRRLLGDGYIEVRYEDLLADPEREVERVLAFLGASTSRAAVSTCVKAASFERGTRGRRAGEEDSTAFLRKGVAGDWRGVFGESDRQVFKEQAGDLLIELGYEQGPDW